MDATHALSAAQGMPFKPFGSSSIRKAGLPGSIDRVKMAKSRDPRGGWSHFGLVRRSMRGISAFPNP
jgi:hypothetical protein